MTFGSIQPLLIGSLYRVSGGEETVGNMIVLILIEFSSSVASSQE
jgi:hypothetical protein